MKNEPALIGAVVAILGIVAAKFGLNVSEGELLAIASGLIAVIGVVVRSKVTPVAKVEECCPAEDSSTGDYPLPADEIGA